MNDTNFLELLQDAQRDPKGVAAREVVKRVLTFINLSSSSIPWGSRERAGEMTKLIFVRQTRQRGLGMLLLPSIVAATPGQCALCVGHVPIR